MFHVELKWKVSHNDRDKEFIVMKRKVERYVEERWKGKDLGRLSCEMMAEELLKEFGAVKVSVFEDGENGAEVSVE